MRVIYLIPLWTPIVAATPFDYPNTIQNRYIGDAIELGYTIKSTGADDSTIANSKLVIWRTC